MTVVGPVRALGGVGEGARLCYEALRALHFRVSVLDVTSLFRTADHEFSADDLPGHPPPGGALIIHSNPPHFDLALAALDPSFIEERKIIAYWAWELAAIPAWWIGSLQRAHEIWVPSRFVAEAIRSTHAARTPAIRVVPHPVATPVCARLSRARFGLSTDAFVVLVVFHIGSGFARKNPLGALRAFRTALGDVPGAQLVMAIRDPNDDVGAYRTLLREVARISNVEILTEKLPRPELNALIACCDVFLSLHRSEGFGLPLAEAMLLGKPVVATGWSGNLEFMNASNACLVDSELVPVGDDAGPYRGTGQMWAEPDVTHAASLLLGLFEDGSRRREIGERARIETTAFFGIQQFRERVRPSLDGIAVATTASGS